MIGLVGRLLLCGVGLQKKREEKKKSDTLSFKIFFLKKKKMLQRSRNGDWWMFQTHKRHPQSEKNCASRLLPTVHHKQQKNTQKSSSSSSSSRRENSEENPYCSRFFFKKKPRICSDSPLCMPKYWLIDCVMGRVRDFSLPPPKTQQHSGRRRWECWVEREREIEKKKWKLLMRVPDLPRRRQQQRQDLPAGKRRRRRKKLEITKKKMSRHSSMPWGLISFFFVCTEKKKDLPSRSTLKNCTEPHKEGIDRDLQQLQIT